jgi:tetratricopeptide (TPR) repeat protein
MAQHPERLDARLSLARCYADAGRLQQALGLLGDTVAEWSGVSEPGRGLAARILRELGRPRDALDVLEASRVFFLGFRVLRAELLAAERGRDAADAEFGILAQDPRADRSVFLIWAHAHEDPRRREILEQGFQRFPADPALAEELAVRRWAAGDGEGALEAAELVLAHDDSSSRAWFVKIETLGRLQPDRDLQQLLERFEVRFANEPSVMLAMADLLSSRSQIGDTRASETALRWTERMWDGDLPPAVVLMTQARLYGALRRWQDALGAVDAVLLLTPESLTALKQRADLLSYMGRHKEAVAAYDTYLAKAPDDLAARRQQARVEGWRQAHEASLGRYADLVEAAPAAEAMRAEAEAKRAFYRGEWKKAIAAYRRWLTLEPDDVEARFELAQSYDLARRPALAEQTYVELLSYLPLHRQVQVADERLQRRRHVAAQPFAEALSTDGYQGQRLLDLFDGGLKISDDLGAGPGTRFSVVAATSRARARQEHYTGRLVTAQAVRSLGAWRVSALAGGRSFPELGGTTAIAQAALSWWPSDVWRVSGGVDRAPVMENLETLRHNLASYGPFGAVRYEPTLNWRFTAHAAWDRLTDLNDRRVGGVEAAHRFVRGATDLRVFGSAEHLAYRATSPLYFSPRSFWREDVGIEWLQQLTPPQFHGDRDRSFLARYSIGTDDRRVIYHTARLGFAYELGRRIALTGQAQWIRSPVYNSSALVFAIRLGGLAGSQE